MQPEATAIEPSNALELSDIATKGARVRLARAGKKSSAGRVLLIHDVLQSHLAWADVIPKVAEHAEVVAIDLPGAGESEKPPASRFSYEVSAFAECVADVVAALGLGRVALVGHGLGAAVALACAAMHPAIATKLVLVSPGVYGEGQGPLDRLAKVPLFGPLALKQFVGASEFKRYFREYVYAEGARVPAERVLAHFDRFGSPAGREATFATLRATRDRRPVVALVPRVRQETLVITGRLDRLVPNSHGRRLVRELATARLLALDTGHSPPEEEPEAFAAALVDFLAAPAVPMRARVPSRPGRGARE